MWGYSAERQTAASGWLLDWVLFPPSILASRQSQIRLEPYIPIRTAHLISSRGERETITRTSIINNINHDEDRGILKQRWIGIPQPTTRPRPVLSPYHLTSSVKNHSPTYYLNTTANTFLSPDSNHDTQTSTAANSSSSVSQYSPLSPSSSSYSSHQQAHQHPYYQPSQYPASSPTLNSITSTSKQSATTTSPT